jgi:hypothetical protein
MSKAPFNIRGEALLSAKANALGEKELDAHTRTAEWLLGVATTTFPTDLDDDVMIALSLQVNFQLEQGVEAGVYKEWYEGDVRSIYAERNTDPKALAIATRLLTSANANALSAVTSLR